MLNYSALSILVFVVSPIVSYILGAAVSQAGSDWAGGYEPIRNALIIEGPILLIGLCIAILGWVKADTVKISTVMGILLNGAGAIGMVVLFIWFYKNR